MKIEGNTVIFKSDPRHYYDECSGRKCNTVRRFSVWSEMKEFEKFRLDFDAEKPNKKIRIINSMLKTPLQESFTRTITDISQFEGYWIISWRHEQ